MWSWLFHEKNPLPPHEQAWVELRMKWLIEREGLENVRKSPAVTPSTDWFSARFDGTEEEIRELFDDVCGWMRIDPESVALDLEPDAERTKEAVGMYIGRDDSGTHGVWLDCTHLDTPMAMVATMAHELGHVVLLGDEWLSPEDSDHEFVTDLFPILRGLGVIAANNTIVKDKTSHDEKFSYWEIRRQGYLPSRILGYALGIWAHARNEDRPAWTEWLRADASEPYHACRRILRRENRPVALTVDWHWGTKDQPHELASGLASSDPADSVATLWKLRRPDCRVLSSSDWRRVIGAFRDRNPVVRAAAASGIAAVERDDEELVDLLDRGLESDDEGEVVSCCAALSRQANVPPATIATLVSFLSRSSNEVVLAAAEALATLGTVADYRPQLLAAFRQSALRASRSSDVLRAVAKALSHLSPDVEGLVRPLFGEHDRELESVVLAELRGAGDRDDDAGNRERLPNDVCLPAPVREARDRGPKNR